MYAPKFRSWMTDWDRFDEALCHRLDAMEAEAKAEIHAMVEKAMPPKKPEYRDTGIYYSVYGGGGFARAMSQEELRILVHQQAALDQNNPNPYMSGLGAVGSVGNLLGGIFGSRRLP